MMSNDRMLRTTTTMDESELSFDFERTLQPVSPVRRTNSSQEDAAPEPPDLPATVIGQQPGNFKKNYRQTVCTYWLKGLCMKGDSCGFLHQLDPHRMPVCRALLKYGVCKEPDCLFKHSLDDIKECNMYKLGFCIYGPQCRYKHTRLPGPVPDPDGIEAAKPREFRNINIVVNEVNPNIATGDLRPLKRPRYLQGGETPGSLSSPPGSPDSAAINALQAAPMTTFEFDDNSLPRGGMPPIDGSHRLRGNDSFSMGAYYRGRQPVMQTARPNGQMQVSPFA